MWAKLFLRPSFINRVHLTWSLRSLVTMQLKTKEFESLFTDGLVGLAGKLTLRHLNLFKKYCGGTMVQG